jgi:hypothetical protein
MKLPSQNKVYNRYPILAWYYSGKVKTSEDCNHYRKLKLCRVFWLLSRAIYRALGTEKLCREPRSAQQYSRHCHLCRGSGCRQARTHGRIKSLPRASTRQGQHPRRRNEHRHIWAVVYCVDGSAVGRRQRRNLCREPQPSSRQSHWPWFTPVDWPLPRARWSRRQSTPLCRRPTLGTGSYAEGPSRLSTKN